MDRHDVNQCNDVFFYNKLSLFESSPLAVAEIDHQGQFMYANKAFCLLVKKSKEMLFSCTDLSLTCPCDIKMEREKREMLKNIKQPYTLDKRYMVNLKPLWVRTFVSLINDEKKINQNFLIAAVDISLEVDKNNHLEVTEKKLRQLVEYDDLTCLKSRRAMENEIQEAFFYFQTKQKRSALVFLDVDNFKQINDTYGHITGDEVLKNIGVHLEQNIRTSDEAGRIGGDEFAVLLRRSDHVDMSQVLDRLSSPISVTHNTIKLLVTLSVGVYVVSNKIASPEEWLNAADQAMYQNKKFKSL